MKYTNKLNLPEVFSNCFKNEDKETIENRYSVTEILGSIREILLYRKYRNEITVDISDKIPALFGSAVHKILEENKTDDCEAEVKLEIKFGNNTLVGIIDSLNLKELLIEDYKTTTTSKVSKNDFSDWYHQDMMYAYMVLIIYDVKIKKLKNYALLKDWSKIKAATSTNYPQSPIFIWEYNVQDSDYDYIYKFIKNKLADIHEHKNNLPECTDEEKWYTGTKYAVYKNVGDKRATIVCDTEQEAHDYITNKCNGAGQIEVRKGENLKCKYYCDCAKFCEKTKERN